MPTLIRRFVERVLGGSTAPLAAYLAESDSGKLSAKGPGGAGNDREQDRAGILTENPERSLMFAIVNFLNHVSTAWATLMLAAVWQSTVLALLVAAVTWRWKHSTPGIRYWLWQIVAFKLLVLPVWTVAIPMPGFFARSLPDRPLPPPAARSLALADRPERRPPSVAPKPAEPAPTVLVPPYSAWSGLSITTGLMMGWIVVVSVLISGVFGQRSRLVRLLQRATPVGDAALKVQVAELAGQLGLRRVPELQEAVFQGSPFVCGLFRPMLVLPEGLVGSIEPVELRQVLLHELAHLKRVDLFWDWFPAIARMLFFFHPVAHWAAGRILLERRAGLRSDRHDAFRPRTRTLRSDARPGRQVGGMPLARIRPFPGWSGRPRPNGAVLSRANHSFDTEAAPMSENPFGPWATALSTPGEARLTTFWSRRMAMLPQLGRSRPALSRRGRCGLLMLAILSLAMPTLRGTSVAPQDGSNRKVSQEAVQEPAKVDDDEQALKEFLETYRLKPGQNLKHVPPPRPDRITRFLLKRDFPNARPDFLKAMIFRVDDSDQVETWGLTRADGYAIRSLPSSFTKGINPMEVEGDPELLKTVVPGDWVFREGVPAEQMIVALESILQLRPEIEDHLEVSPGRARRSGRTRPLSYKCSSGPVQEPGRDLRQAAR